MSVSSSAFRRVDELNGRRALGESISHELTAWAVDMLVEGYDSKSLRTLAGYSEFVSPGEIGEEYDRAQAELGFLPQPLRETLNQYSQFICERVVRNEIDLDQALAVLYKIWVETYCDSELRGDGRHDVWMYLSDSLQLIEGGHGPLLPEFVGLSAKNYHEFLTREAQKFLDRYHPHRPE